MLSPTLQPRGCLPSSSGSTVQAIKQNKRHEQVTSRRDLFSPVDGVTQTVSILQAHGFLDRGTSDPTPVSSADGFVRHFRSAAPYIALHRDSTFVVVFPGTVIQDKNAVVRCKPAVGTHSAKGLLCSTLRNKQFCWLLWHAPLSTSIFFRILTSKNSLHATPMTIVCQCHVTSALCCPPCAAPTHCF